MKNNNIITSLTQAVTELLHVANMKPGQILVIGCSTSEITGHHIGQKSNLNTAYQVMDVMLPLAKENKIFLAIQSCEHLNRALVVEEECATKYDLEIVNVLPHETAGGSLATSAMARFANPIVVENIKGHAGIDIGDTFIGMHLKPVVVPVRTSVNKIGYAHLTIARTRPKFIGGARAKYSE